MLFQSTLIALIAAVAMAAPSELVTRDFQGTCDRGTFKASGYRYSLDCDTQPKIAPKGSLLYISSGDSYNILECADVICSEDPECKIAVFAHKTNECYIYGKGGNVISAKENVYYDYAIKGKRA